MFQRNENRFNRLVLQIKHRQAIQLTIAFLEFVLIYES